MKFLTAREFAAEANYSTSTVVRICNAKPGFGFRIGAGKWNIPEQHLRLVLAGTPVEVIAQQARERAAERRSA